MLVLSSLALLLGTASAAAVEYSSEALLDQVTKLPGADGLDFAFKQFSGYLQIPGVDGTLSKNMHYWVSFSTS
jgi:hypothetical protein